MLFSDERSKVVVVDVVVVLVLVVVVLKDPLDDE